MVGRRSHQSVGARKAHLPLGVLNQKLHSSTVGRGPRPPPTAGDRPLRPDNEPSAHKHLALLYPNTRSERRFKHNAAGATRPYPRSAAGDGTDLLKQRASTRIVTHR